MIAVRPAMLDDVEAISRQAARMHRLHRDALPFIFSPPSKDLFPPEKLATLIENPNCIVAVAERQGKVVGHVYAELVSVAEDEYHQAHLFLCIHQIGVDDEAQRQGAGTTLVAFVRDWARALGVTALQADCWAFNARSRAFFEACGFSPMKVTMRQALKDD